MTLKKIDPVLRDVLIRWFRAIETELKFKKPNIELVLEAIQTWIEALTSFPDVLKAIKESENVKEGVLDLQN